MQNAPNRSQRKLDLKRERLRRSRGASVVGFVDPEAGHTHSIKKRRTGEWVKADEPPDLYIAAKLEPVVTTNKRFVCVIGGRGSSKSLGVGDICLMKAKDSGSKTYCLREYQSSIKNSVHSLLSDEISRLEFTDFEVMDNSIRYKGFDAFQFAGIARNVESIKSAHGFANYWVEESQGISGKSLQELTPTARNKPNKGLPGAQTAEYEDVDVQMIFVANPASSNDPFSKRFIVPFKSELDKYGFYEDDLHLIVVLNYQDNPWFMESGLNQEREFDFEHKARATYRHIWLGGFNDHVERAIIKPEWFDAAIDAHIKLGIKPTGARVSAFDVADTEEGDSKGYASRKGILYDDVRELAAMNGNIACSDSIEIAIKANTDLYLYDADGMGALLRDTINTGFNGVKCEIRAYRGSNSVDDPKALYEGHSSTGPKDKPKTNKDTFANKRAQKYIELADKFYRTWLWVERNEYQDPDSIISLSSDIEFMDKLRSEVCRIPRKPNPAGKIQLMSKEEMKRVHNIESPGMSDCLAMCTEVPDVRGKRVKIEFVEGF